MKSKKRSPMNSLVLPLYRNSRKDQEDIRTSEWELSISSLRKNWWWKFIPSRLERFFIDEPRRSLILIHITFVQQIFNSFDPSPFHERDIDADAEQFIVTMAESLLHQNRVDIFQINVHVSELPTEEEYYLLFKKKVDLNSVTNINKDGSLENMKQVKPIKIVHGTTEDASPPLPGAVRDTQISKSVDIKTLITSSGVRTASPWNRTSPNKNHREGGVLEGNELLKLLSEDLKITLQNHFAFQSELTRNEIQRTLSTGRWAAVFGFAMMLVALTLSKLIGAIEIPPESIIPYNSILSDALEISAWLFWWRPIEILVFSWWPLAARKRLFDKLCSCDLKVYHDQPSSTSTVTDKRLHQETVSIH